MVWLLRPYRVSRYGGSRSVGRVVNSFRMADLVRGVGVVGMWIAEPRSIRFLHSFEAAILGEEACRQGREVVQIDQSW